MLLLFEELDLFELLEELEDLELLGDFASEEEESVFVLLCPPEFIEELEEELLLDWDEEDGLLNAESLDGEADDALCCFVDETPHPVTKQSINAVTVISATSLDSLPITLPFGVSLLNVCPLHVLLCSMFNIQPV